MTLTRRQFARETFGAAAGIGILSMTGCGGPTLISLLNDLIQDGSELLDIAFPQYAALLSPLVSELTTFADQLTTELASTSRSDSSAISSVRSTMAPTWVRPVSDEVSSCW